MLAGRQLAWVVGQTGASSARRISQGGGEEGMVKMKLLFRRRRDGGDWRVSYRNDEY